MTTNTVSTIDDRITALMDDLERHPVYDNDYFTYLENSAWNDRTFDFHRANFFHRTEGTVMGIAHVCAQAAARDDTDTLILFAHILGEETGDGDPARCHEVLMERAHNLHGHTEFGVEPLLVKQARYSPLVLPETVRYRERALELLTGSYHRMLGVTMALESHADRMLRICRTAFRNTRDDRPLSEFVNDIEIYFNVHLDNGVEERHAADAKKCVVNNCHGEVDVEEIAYGATETLEVQLEMWNAMYRSVRELDPAGIR